MANTNKVKFGIKNCHYAVATIASNGTATYSTPVALPGAVSLSLEPQGENTPFYADNIIYYIGAANSGYQGDLELASVPDAFKKDVLGFATDGNGVLYEDANASVVHFALTFEFSGDAHARRHVMYNCTATRPSVASSTTTETKEPQTEAITITATSIYVSALSTDVTKAACNYGDAQYSSWNTSIYQLTATSTT